MAATQQWGTTPPVSMAFPTDKEITLNDTLVEELKNQNNFEAVEETEKRYADTLHASIFHLLRFMQDCCFAYTTKDYC